ncbi:MAG: tetratricopeptide repeat protein [Pirellulaceae bacterium]
MTKSSVSKPAPPSPVRSESSPVRSSGTLWRWGILALVVGAGGVVFADWWIVVPESETAHYVGSASCIDCHAQEAERWRGSYHDLAMDPATPETVLGDFQDAELTHFGITSRMFRRDGKFYVHTEGADGQMADFEVKYVLGVAPLQQYMVEFDRPADARPDEVGRVQVLPICWDTRQKKWFFLQPPDVSERVLPGDDLHWTGIAQRWNNMCADCHTTNYHKNFDARSQQYHTTFTDMDVSCEACHGPGSVHVQLASASSLFWDRKRGYGLANLKDSNPRTEIETCAPCHSMRRIVHTGFQGGQPFFDSYANELLLGHLYHADGQIREEVYEYGSFTQSKMYQKGIRCSDCHDPHSTQVKYQGNQLCTSCHQHPAGKYDTPNHHHHAPGREGALCTSCHMPKTTYMEVDPRLDHSLRIPRPDVSVQVGTPNACSGCHLAEGGLPAARSAQLPEYADWLRAAREGDGEVKEALAKVDRWAAERFTAWYGTKADAADHYATTLTAARRGDLDARERLIKLIRDRRLSGILRATCLFELGQYAQDDVVSTSAEMLTDEEPLVRLAALPNLERLPEDQLVKRAAPLLRDPLRAVRAEAGRVLARVDIRWLDGPQRQAREAALEEYRQGLVANNDRAVAHLGLGVLAEQLGDLPGAREAYETALRIEPQMAGPRANLAALLEQFAASERDETAAQHLARRVQDLRQQELELLRRDAQLVPRNASVRYRLGLSLYLHGQLAEAEHELREAVQLSPNTADFVLGLALLLQKQNQIPEAIEWTRRLLVLRPGDPSYAQLLAELEQQQRPSGQPAGPPRP